MTVLTKILFDVIVRLSKETETSRTRMEKHCMRNVCLDCDYYLTEMCPKVHGEPVCVLHDEMEETLREEEELVYEQEKLFREKC